MKAYRYFAVMVVCCATARGEVPREVLLEQLPADIHQPPSEVFRRRTSSSSSVQRPDREAGDAVSRIQLSAVRPPEGLSAAAPEIAVPPSGGAVARSTGIAVAWEPPNQRHLPVYFEDVAVERYGQTMSPPLQPIASGGKFLAQAALLPYQMGVESPRRLNYDVGFARPGSPTPPVRERLPLSARGILYQGAASTGLIYFMHP